MILVEFRRLRIRVGKVLGQLSSLNRPVRPLSPQDRAPHRRVEQWSGLYPGFFRGGLESSPSFSGRRLYSLP